VRPRARNWIAVASTSAVRAGPRTERLERDLAVVDLDLNLLSAVQNDLLTGGTGGRCGTRGGRDPLIVGPATATVRAVLRGCCLVGAMSPPRLAQECGRGKPQSSDH